MLQFPVTVDIFGVSVLVHSIMEALGFFCGARYYWYLRRKQTEKPDIIVLLTVLVGATFGAYFCSHLLGALENIPQWIASPDKLSYFLFNKTIVGGLLGGLIGVELAKKTVKEKRSTGDLFVYPLLLAMIIGRIGCLSAGIYEETYGLPTSLPWGMDLGDRIPRHPVNLYEIGFLIFTWIILRKTEKTKNLQSGGLFKLFMIFYLIFRFLLDFIKPGWRYFFGIGTIQIACLLGLLYYGKYILGIKKYNIT
jgi:prolipoprotein diacylglyceryltransferase